MTARELTGRTALVTGASKNIGRAIALDLARAGARVLVTARSNEAGLHETVALIAAEGGAASSLLADLTVEADVAALIQAARNDLGGLDILVNNAAIRTEIPFEKLTLADFRAVTAVALEAPFLCSQAALPLLKASNAASIINIGGLSAYVGARDRAHVIAAKAGLDGLTKALAHDLAGDGITVNLVSPGLIDTVRSAAGQGHPQLPHTHATLVGRRGTSEEVAAMVRFLCGPQARYLTGQTIHVNGGAFLP